MSKAIFFCSRLFVSKKRSSLNKAMDFFCDSLKASCPCLSHSNKGSNRCVTEPDGALLTARKTSSIDKDRESGEEKIESISAVLILTDWVSKYVEIARSNAWLGRLVFNSCESINLTSSEILLSKSSRIARCLTDSLFNLMAKSTADSWSNSLSDFVRS